MEPLKVKAQLCTNMVVFDDYSPSLDAILTYQILDDNGLIVPSPTIENVRANQPLIDEQMPLAKGQIAEEWYWQCSGPCYSYYKEGTTHFAKRWTPGTDTPNPDWGKRKAKFTASEGKEKSCRLPLFIRTVPTVTWFVVGDRDGLTQLLDGVTGIGKKRSLGHGMVINWEVTPDEGDRHLWCRNELMRPIPIAGVDRPTSFGIRQWAFRPPGHVIDNSTRCAMPIATTEYCDAAVPS